MIRLKSKSPKMKKISEKYNSINPLKHGEIVEGKIIGKQGIYLFVDLSPQGTGLVLEKEFTNVKNLSTGQKIIAKVIDPETDEEYIHLSVEDAQKEILWRELEEKRDKKEVLKIKVLGANKGGLTAIINKVSAFLPVSQLSAANYPKVEQGDPQKILGELQKFIDQQLEVNIYSLDKEQNQIILSEKLKETEKKKNLLEKYQIGDIVEGEITGLCDFGAFLKFPASQSKTKTPTSKKTNKDLEGLIHISELDWQLVEDPSEIIKIGQKIKAKILKIQDTKVFLSLKALKKNPWQNIKKKIKKGDIVKGKVKKLNPYGVFVEVLPNIQGLCHISEFKAQEKMEKTLKTGKTYDFKVLMINPEEYKITLSFAEK